MLPAIQNSAPLFPIAAGSGVSVRTVFRTPKVAIARWRCAAGLDGVTAELRHPWYLISFTHVGTFMLHARGQDEMIDATRAMVIAPGEVFRMTRGSEATASGSAISVHPDLFAGMRPARCRGEVSLPAPSSAILLQHLMLRRLDDAGQAEIEESALRVAAETVAPPNGDAPAAHQMFGSGRRRAMIADIQMFLAAQFTDLIRLEDLARAINRSRFHLCRSFRESTGLQVHSYLRRLRLRSAVERVIEFRGNLSDLALGLGYSSHSHFDVAFRSEFHLSPTELRRIAMLPRLADMRTALGFLRGRATVGRPDRPQERAAK
ncbi:MAG TPA: AraC family transcriptional regulator [Thermoanaerobaculia bacterium]|nr:AraC family transcriptional regulator [Thermoanaerobaculia bacterium]